MSSRVLVLFGSVNGNSEAVAKRIHDSVLVRGLGNASTTSITSLNDFDSIESGSTRILMIVVCSTTGDGDFPDNAIRFCRHLRALETGSLSHVSFAVLALGDTNYSKFCNAGKMIDRRLAELGAHRFHPIGCADDAVGLDEVVEPWINGLWDSLSKNLGDFGCDFSTSTSTTTVTDSINSAKVVKSDFEKPAPHQPVSFTTAPSSTPALQEQEENTEDSMLPHQDEKIEKQFELVTFTNEQLASSLKLATLRHSSLPSGCCSPFELAFPDPSLSNDGIPNQKYPFLGQVVFNRELLASTASSERSTRHIEFNTRGSKMTHEAGDHLGVFGANPEWRIHAYAERLQLSEDQMQEVVQFRGIESRKFLLPKIMTLNTVFKQFLDLGAPVHPRFLRGMALYATDETERTRLEHLGSKSKEGQEEFQQLIRHHCMTPLDILLEFPSVHPPLDHFVELMPTMRPRFYSIASSSQSHPDSVHIVVSVTRFETPSGRVSHGLCSHFLSQLKEGEVASIFVRKSKFHLPDDVTRPVIMVGPGTGVAPFVGFVHQRRAMLLQSSVEKQRFGEMDLYFGCRRRDEDFICQEELDRAASDGVLSGLHVAFSREQPDGRKCYVQHKLQQNAATVWECLKRNGHFFVCGDAKQMAKDVDRCLVEICSEQERVSIEEATQLVEQLISEGRYLRDLWASHTQ